jgi:peptide/nickel transport system ATP-binding protein
MVIRAFTPVFAGYGPLQAGHPVIADARLGYAASQTGDIGYWVARLKRAMTTEGVSRHRVHWRLGKMPPTPESDLLAVENLRVSFSTGRGTAQVLDGVSLTIGAGEIVGLVGESGCGKTTLANAILGVLAGNARHEAGEIRFRGADLLAMPRRQIADEIRGRCITFIPQDPFGSFNPLFPIGTQIMEVMKWKSPRRSPPEGRGIAGLFARYPGARRTADALSAAEMLRTVQIPQAEAAFAKLPHELSGGQRQRLMIALALLPDPQLVIADEPTTALDVTIQAQILKLLKRLAKERGVSVLFTTHDLGTAWEICDRITVMYAGQEVESAPVDDFFRRPHHPYTVRLLESLPRPGREPREIGGEIPSLVDPPRGCRFHPRCDRATEICRSQRPAITLLGRGHQVRCHHPVTQDSCSGEVAAGSPERTCTTRDSRA